MECNHCHKSTAREGAYCQHCGLPTNAQSGATNVELKKPLTKVNKGFVIGVIGIIILLIVGSAVVFGNKGENSDSLASTQTPSPLIISPTPSIEMFRVTEVVDGDTIKVDIYGVLNSVRLIGLDTPETKDPRKPVQCYGIEATEKMKQLVEGKTVVLVGDSTQADRDNYDRLLRYVYLEDGTFVNQLMIVGGYAFEYTYDYPYQFQDDFKNAQTVAMNTKRGLWSETTCNGTVEPSPTPLATLIPATPTSVLVVNTPQPTTPIIPVATATSAPVACLYSCVSPDRDCEPDFATHSEAQTFFNCCGFTATNDPMKLDGTGVDDGIACESLP